jgi:hypothetical protein
MLGGVGGFKAAAKRTAFGDVSNTSRILSTAHDDSMIKPVTAANQENIKPIVHQDKSSALLRPAQRPLNAPTGKGPLNSNAVAVPVQVLAAARQPLVETKPSQPAALKRAPSKKATIIYKDADAEVAQRQTQGVLSNASRQVPVASIHQPLPRALDPVLRRTESRVLIEHGEQARPATAGDNTVYLDANEGRIATSDEDFEAYMKGLEANDSQKIAQEAERKRSIDASLARVDDFERRQRQLPPLPLAEPEEYWEEEEEEVYDDQGYTTAHSYRSRGDNTTGGVTTILAPKITNKVKQELAVAKEIVESARTREEIEDEAWDTSMVAEYGDEIFAYMRDLENKMLPNPNYMDTQSEIQWSMRSVLMDWLIQVHHRFSLLPETLFLCVNYIDRFLSCKIVSLGKLQLVGATAIFVAAKYEEINCPSVNEIVYMVDGGYTVDEILKAERFMLSMLQFELGWPGPMSFLRRISKADDYDLETRTLAKYFLEVTIMDERFVGSPPSYIAAGAHCLARMLLKKGDWSPAHIYYSGYTWGQLRPLVSMIKECCDNAHKHHSAVFEKYADRRYKRASLFVETEIAKGFAVAPMQSFQLSLPTLEDVAARMPFETNNAVRTVQTKA